MESQYYYFISSLPSLSFHQKASATYEDFLLVSQDQVSQADWRILHEARLDLEPQESQNAFLGQWADFNRHLKNEIARLRARKFSYKEADVVKGSYVPDAFCLEAVSRALKAAHPLDAERLLDEARWNKLEALSSGYYFEFPVLIVYALKLQLLARRHVLSSDEGPKRFEAYQKDVFEKIVF